MRRVRLSRRRTHPQTLLQRRQKNPQPPRLPASSPTESARIWLKAPNTALLSDAPCKTYKHAEENRDNPSRNLW